MKIETKEHAITLQKLATALSTIHDCPRYQGVVEVLGEDLAELCDSWEEAEWVVKTARSKWEEWRGRHGLEKLLYDRRFPELPPTNSKTYGLPANLREEYGLPPLELKDLGPRPKFACQLCEDWGHVLRDGKHVFCSCESGEWLKKAWPGHLKVLNRRNILKPKPARELPPPITHEEIMRAYRGQKNAADLEIIRERAILSSSDYTPERKEMARLTLRNLGVVEEVSV